MVADADSRRAVYERCFAVVVDHALQTGIVHTTADRSAVAVWFRAMGPLDNSDFDARLAEAAGEHVGRFAVKAAATAGHHPTDPHHHLAFLGVHPHRQAGGVGSALLQEHHRTLDAAGTAAFLEATTERSRRLYLRHGYISAEPIYLPEGGPPMWPMWRRPLTTHTDNVADAIRRVIERSGGEAEDAAVVVDESGLILFGDVEERPARQRIY
ncbi:GNAT family N-acetyltransferase [Asanoa iriomotensis]|uniref:GNAT family N-acetyltransferase n=1 Tax=Asanoa iriomotensis TaxID=234613 RepID=UPI001EF2A804|nr:GNAT family N-acetyltransferase [Asanoa iriomotensis]